MKTMCSRQNWIRMWEAQGFSFLHVEIIAIEPYTKKLQKVAGFADNNLIIFAHNDFAAGYYLPIEMDKAAKNGLKQFSNKNYSQKYFLDTKNLIRKAYTFIKKIERLHLESIDNNKLENVFKENIENCSNLLTRFITIQPQCVKGVEDKIRKYLESKTDRKSALKAFTRLTESSKITFLRQEELDWLKIIAKAYKFLPGAKQINYKQLKENHPQLIKEIESHCKKYGTIPSGEGKNKAWDMDQIVYKYIV